MKKLIALLFAAAGIAHAQTYNYNAVDESLVITGNGKTQRFMPSAPITPGSTVPGTSEVFRDTKTITIKDIYCYPDSISIQYIIPVSAGNHTVFKLENAILSTTGAFDTGGSSQTLIIDAQSELITYASEGCFHNTDRIENSGRIEMRYISTSLDGYIWSSDAARGIGCSGILGGSGELGGMSDFYTERNYGLIKYDGQITDLSISGDYTIDLDGATTSGAEGFVAGVNTSQSSAAQGMDISGSVTIKARSGTGLGLYLNQIGGTDEMIENNYSGKISVIAKNAFGIKVGNSLEMSGASAGDIYALSLGTLNAESPNGNATGIFAGEVKRSLSANSVTVKGNTSAAGMMLCGGGRNISAENIKVTAGLGSNAYGIVASDNTSGSVASCADMENLRVGNMNVSGGADTVGVFAKSLKGTNTINALTATSANGIATGVYVEEATLAIGRKITATGGNSAYGIYALSDLDMTLADGATITAVSNNQGGAAYAVYAQNGDVKMHFEGQAQLNGGIRARTLYITGSSDVSALGDIEANLAGASANAFAKNFYDIKALGIGGLVGVHTPVADSHRIFGTISDTSISDTSLGGRFIDGSATTALSWEITSNTYLQDLCTNERERAFAARADAIAYTGNALKDRTSVLTKNLLAASILSGYGLAVFDMSTAAKSAYETSALAEEIFRDTFFKAGRISDTWSPSEDAAIWEIGVNSINRFGTSGGGEDFDYNTHGGSAQLDLKAGDFVVGGGLGGWYSKVRDGALGKTSSEIISATIYSDWNFAESFEFFAEINYARAFNTLDKNGLFGFDRSDWESNLVGGFTALRYSHKLTEALSVKPFAGVMAVYNMQNDLSMAGAADVNGKNYTNCKGLAGIEAALRATANLYVSARAVYAYEFADNKYDVDTVVTGLGGVSYTAYETSRSSVIAGFGANYQITPAWSAGINYNAEIRSSRLGNNINANLCLKF